MGGDRGDTDFSLEIRYVKDHPNLQDIASLEMAHVSVSEKRIAKELQEYNLLCQVVYDCMGLVNT